jgi:hypothetical protein
MNVCQGGIFSLFPFCVQVLRKCVCAREHNAGTDGPEMMALMEIRQKEEAGKNLKFYFVEKRGEQMLHR